MVGDYPLVSPPSTEAISIFRELADAAQNPTWIVASTGSALHRNRAFADWTDLADDDPGGWLERLHPDDPKQFTSNLVGTRAFQILGTLRLPDGATSRFTARAVPLAGGCWFVTAWPAPAGFAADLLRAHLFEEGCEAAFAWHLDSPRILVWNRGAERLYGHPASHALGRSPHELLATRFPCPLEAVEAALRAEGDWAGELVHRDHAGRARVVEARMRLVPQPDGSELVLETSREVTERRRLEQAALQAQTRLQLALAAGRTGIWEWDLATGQVYWSEQTFALLGLDPSAFGGTYDDFLDVVHPEHRDRVDAEVRAVLRGERECDLEFRIVRPDGVGRWVHSRALVERDAEERAVRMVGTWRDIDDRKGVEQSLRASEEQARARADELASILEAVPAAVWITHDPECRQIFGNRLGHELLRAPLGANLSATPPEPVHPPAFRVRYEGRELAPHELPMQVVARTGLAWRDIEEEVEFEDGEVVHICGSTVPLFDADGAPRGAVAAFVDVTRLKQAEAALREAHRRKDEFLAILSHELRNPLAPILSAARLMEVQGHLSPERAVIERQTRHLVRLVDDLLDVARVASGKIELRRARIELATVVARAMETTTALVEQRQHQIAVDVPDGLVVDADEVRLAQVVANLLTNAVRYTPPGGRIEVSAEQDGGEVVIRVRDDGIGMTPELLPVVFERFVQGGSRPEQGGLGLGLSLVRSLTELHGGAVEAHSDGPGLGSTFVVHLPVARDESAREVAPPHEVTPAAPPSRPATTRRVLVVDDNADAAELLAALLSDVGHEVRVATDPSAALEVAPRFAPEVAILDIGLPGMDGHELGARLRVALGDEPPMLIALTGYGRDLDRQRSQAAGFEHHLVKPADPQQILDLIAAVD